MQTQLKKGLILLVAAFLIYAMFKSPVRSAHVVSEIWDAIVSGLRAIREFFDALLGR